MKFNVSAGHNPDGKIACGATGYLKESTEARNVTAKVIKKLQSLGHTVYDCTCNNGTSQNDVLQRIVAKCNAHKVDLDISIHFNSGANDTKGNGVTTGTEVWVYTGSTITKYATAVCKEIANLGFKNRGVKSSSGLYFLKHTNSSSMLIECNFVDDKDDADLYNAEKMATAIVKGITGKSVNTSTDKNVSTPTTSSKAEKDENKDFKVRVNVKSLNIRKGAGTKYAVVNKITDKGTYTITEVENNWGKLKSGIGWINLSKDYVTRI